jgi:hypothetical protein
MPIRGYVAFGPPESAPFFSSALPRSIRLIEAWYPDLGDCLFAAIEQLFDFGHRAAVVLNSDSPTLPASLLVEAAEQLACPGDRVVLGPARDGGYYLLGLKARHRRLFERIAWSTEQVAAQTLERAAEIGLAVHVLSEWYDIDDVSSLRALATELGNGPRLNEKTSRDAAVHTSELMRTLLAQTDLRARIGLLADATIEGAAE